MSMTDLATYHRKLAQLVANLTYNERSWLLENLMLEETVKKTPDVKRLHTQELLQAETWLWQRAKDATMTRDNLPRWRMWCIFLLLRYGALRVVEIMRLSHDDLDFTRALVHVGEDRTVPLPLDIARRLQRVWLNVPFAVVGKTTPLSCDQSTIRRAFQHCGEACGLPKGLLTARALRHNRALELARQGIPMAAINVFLGRHVAQNRCELMSLDRDNAEKLLQEHIHTKRIMKTSARNVFQGRIEQLQKEGILVRVTMRTAAGLRLTALITDTSYNRLALQEGTLVNASIKAPWVMVLPPNTLALAENCYTGIVEQVRSDANVMEILITLTEGSQVCALCTKDENASFEEGKEVTVYFKAFAVILTLD